MKKKVIWLLLSSLIVVTLLIASCETKTVDQVEEDLADPCLAKPIFASVNLQRRELTNNRSWSEWQDVPRTKIDRYAKIYDVKEDYEDLSPGGLRVHSIQLNQQLVQLQLLQPEPYQLASADNEWLPPRLHRKFLSALNKERRSHRLASL